MLCVIARKTQRIARYVTENQNWKKHIFEKYLFVPLISSIIIKYLRNKTEEGFYT